MNALDNLPKPGDVNYVVIREPSVRPETGEGFTLSKVYRNGIYFCECCEDEDRLLEKGGVKVATRTAIPRGLYRVIVSMSNRFKKLLPEVLHVDQFSGIRIHGGNKAEHSEGCLLWGRVRTANGIADCPATIAKLIADIQTAEKGGKRVWLEVK